MTSLGVSNLCKSYGALKVTNNVSLSVESGELHAIIGPNGAGKTTLISQLSGQLNCDSGSVFIGDRDISRSRPFCPGLPRWKTLRWPFRRVKAPPSASLEMLPTKRR